jgi:hypothetical protein
MRAASQSRLPKRSQLYIAIAILGSWHSWTKPSSPIIHLKTACTHRSYSRDDCCLAWKPNLSFVMAMLISHREAVLVGKHQGSRRHGGGSIRQQTLESRLPRAAMTKQKAGIGLLREDTSVSSTLSLHPPRDPPFVWRTLPLGSIDIPATKHSIPHISAFRKKIVASSQTSPIGSTPPVSPFLSIRVCLLGPPSRAHRSSPNPTAALERCYLARPSSHLITRARTALNGDLSGYIADYIWGISGGMYPRTLSTCNFVAILAVFWLQWIASLLELKNVGHA